jgi:mannan endo-1,4-beta-mannosidase
MKKWILLFTINCMYTINTNAQSKEAFVQVKEGHFVLNGKPMYYAGTNYWYGSLLSLQTDNSRGISRMRKELDFLKAHGITNLRIVAGAEGTGMIQGVPRIAPALQPQKGVFNDGVLASLDVLLHEMSQRNMKAVVMLSNNWEWSGGFLQYLNWNDSLPDAMLRQKLSWDSLRDVVSKFYSCQPCVQDYLAQVQKVITHSNTVNGKAYTQDPTIISWELANEPRPMRPAAIPAYLQWIDTASAFIKSLDANHLVTTGSEGWIGSENMQVFKQAHSYKNIDYLTIHIWPKNWGWLRADSMQKDFPQALANTNAYLQEHVAAAQALNKPLVLEEFGLPRDGYSFSPDTRTELRDIYYQNMFAAWQKSAQQGGNISGINFWAFGGIARPLASQAFWKQGDDYMGDPPMEEQGLYSVFDNDKSTWKVINKAIKKVGKMN